MLLHLLALLLLATPAAAEPVDAIELAQTLGIEGTEEAVLLVVADGDLDKLVVGVRKVGLAPADEGGFQRLVRGLVPGVVSLQVERGDLVWRGELPALGGEVTVFDAEAALASPQVEQRAAADAAEFDLFDFYDALDARDVAGQIALCGETLAGLPEGPDRGLVSQACAKVEADAAAAEAEDQALEEATIVDLGERRADRPDTALRGDVLFRADGQARKAPAGTVVRVPVGAASAVLSGLFVGTTFGSEVSAQRAYLQYRAAERTGDDRVMTEQLFLTQRYDRGRDASIGLAVGFFASAVANFVWQGVEQSAFRKAREARAAQRNALLLPVPTRDGVLLTLTWGVP
jgi:hypothetical protein